LDVVTSIAGSMPVGESAAAAIAGPATSAKAIAE
jgi:hypothetical protein